LTYQAKACEPNSSCAICEDTGLGLSITVAREIGHLMGCKNDDGADTHCKPMDDDGNFYVMSPTVKTGISSWSSCSRKSMKEFLENGLGDCLLDEPQDHSFRLP
jgi:hypothetical protein